MGGVNALQYSGSAQFKNPACIVHLDLGESFRGPLALLLVGLVAEAAAGAGPVSGGEEPQAAHQVRAHPRLVSRLPPLDLMDVVDESCAWCCPAA